MSIEEIENMIVVDCDDLETEEVEELVDDYCPDGYEVTDVACGYAYLSGVAP